MGTNPFTIPIGTSDPLNLCYGLPLFPLLGTTRAGVSASSRSYTLLDISATILATRIKVSAYASYGFGVCGPAIGFLSEEVEVYRANSSGTGQLTLTFNEGLMMEAGAFVGASVGAGLTLALQVYMPQPWWKVWTIAWRDAFKVDLGFSMDILQLLVELIQYLLSRSSKSLFKKDTQDRLKGVLAKVSTYSLVDGAGSRDAVEKELTATPALTLPINMVNYFPPLKALNDSLSNVCGEVSVGPSIHVQFPVTFKFDRFTVIGGLDGPPSADYGDLDYAGKQVSATGNTEFDMEKTPSRVTTHVTYKTSFTIAISFHFRASVSKFFNFEVNTQSLDLIYLLTGIPESDRAGNIPNSVSTSVEGGCVLTPNMTLTFTGSNNRSLQTGEPVKGTINLPQYQSSQDATVALSIEPEVDGFPDSVTIPAGSQSASFNFTFQNGCMATGNRNDPSETAPPSPISPLQSYNVSAVLKSPSNNPCSDYEVDVPLTIEERFIRCQAPPNLYKPAPAPPWDSLAGARINADPSLPSGGIQALPVAAASCWFPYLPNEPTVTVPVTFTLLDENREPHEGKDVRLHLGGKFVPLKPSVTGRVTLERSRVGVAFSVFWHSKGPHTGYSNRFYLIVDAGCKYGQTEYWLDVWNWS